MSVSQRLVCRVTMHHRHSAVSDDSDNKASDAGDDVREWIPRNALHSAPLFMSPQSALNIDHTNLTPEIQLNHLDSYVLSQKF